MKQLTFILALATVALWPIRPVFSMTADEICMGFITFESLAESPGGPVVLRPFSIPEIDIDDSWLNKNAKYLRRGLVLDTETEGLNRRDHKIISIGLRPFQYDHRDGRVVRWLEPYNGFQDPGRPLKPLITELTGLTNKKLKELEKTQKIDWGRVHDQIKDAAIVISHNAAFDRPFVDRKVPVSVTKVWACSLNQIDWRRAGYNSSRLESLAAMHGFYVSGIHSAQADADAILKILGTKNRRTGETHLKELLESSREKTGRIKAHSTHPDTRTRFVARRYRWNGNGEKYWHKVVSEKGYDVELRWLKERIYQTQSDDLPVFWEPIDAVDRFKLLDYDVDPEDDDVDFS